MSDTTASNVVAALARVMADLPGIGKTQTASQQQGGYAYRGIEQITQAAQPLLAKHGVVFVPRIISYEIREITVNGKPWTDTIEMVEYDVFGPGGITDKITVGPILAIGRDNSDKGANKCLTQAYKYALLQALCISDAKDDADGQAHEAEYPNRRAAEVERISAEAVEALSTRCKESGVNLARVAFDGSNGRTTEAADLYVTEMASAMDALRSLSSAKTAEASAPAEEQANGPEVGNGNGTQGQESSSGPGSRTRKAAT